MKTTWYKGAGTTSKPENIALYHTTRKATRLDLASGFTIIEVLIVLAIAALIILIVLLAVPALQRSQRNTSRKSDASRVSAAVVDFTANNNGALPSTVANCTSLVTALGTLAQFVGFANPCVAANVVAAIPAAPTASTFYIDTAGVAVANVTTSSTPTTNVMILANGTQCTSATSIAVGTARQTALLYTTEAGNTWAWACVNPQ